MHGCGLGSAFLVNAEVDSMGGVIDGGVGISTKTSPRRAAIEKAQAELRQEYDVREERRKELEFLEKGGNPLDFKSGNAASLSVQSTSLNDQPNEHFVTSDAKGSFALTASPRGDSVESSGRPGAPTGCEPNIADNLLLFDDENKFLEGGRNFGHPKRSTIAPSEQSSQLDGSQNAKESGESPAFGLPKNRAYKRRNRSRPNRDGARSSSTDILPSRVGQISSLPSRHGPKDVKGLGIDKENQKDQNVSLNCNSKPASPKVGIALKASPSDKKLDVELDGVQALESTLGPTEVSLSEPVPDYKSSSALQDNQHNQQPQVDDWVTSAASAGPDSISGREHVVPATLECPPSGVIGKVENQTTSVQLNGNDNPKEDRKSTLCEGQNSSAGFSGKGLDSESSCTQTSHSLDGNNGSDPCNNLRNIESNGNIKGQALSVEDTPSIGGSEVLREKIESADGNRAVVNHEQKDVCQNPQGNGSVPTADEGLCENGPDLQNEVKCPTSTEPREPDGNTVSESGPKPGNLNNPKENDCAGRHHGSAESSIHDNSDLQKKNVCSMPKGSTDSSILGPSGTSLSVRGSICSVTPEKHSCSEIQTKLANKAHEDSILEEARIIQAKRKRIAELSVSTLPMEHRRKSHWDFVLEEMAWLANDFAQERLWKIAAAGQICHRVASTSRLRFEEQNICWEQKKVAHTLAKAIMEFWHSAEVLLKETSRELELRYPAKDSSHAVLGYALRFLKYNASLVSVGLAEAPATPDRISDFGIVEVSWEDNFTEENLFYTVPHGSMETYRKSIESHLVEVERTGSSIQEEVETSLYDAAADNAYEEDEGETNTYYLHGAFEGSRQPKFVQKRRKNLPNYTTRRYHMGTDLPFSQCVENKLGTQQPVLMGKRPGSCLNVGLIPTKRIRTASRLRVLSPFNPGTSGGAQGPNKTDASSGDTSSFQDDQSTFHGGSQAPNGLEVESVSEFEKQLPFDSLEVSKPKKKKKPRHLGSTYEQRWQGDNSFQNEQRDHSRKRLDSHQLDSNGNSGLYGQLIVKKPKMVRPSLDNSFDSLTPMTGSIPSPVASQMSNMSNPNKLIKILSGRDRGKKPKSLKIPTGQPGPGSPWSLFEDQALVVLVHDMGPNWELVSDAINSTLQYKCIFRNPKECRERHKILMDRTAGDGADSADDSGSSQPYPSTLPGIPKGSARQLFQRLQGPMEEDMIKSHFEQIIRIFQKLHNRKTQNVKQDTKQIPPKSSAHSSHEYALSQACPNHLNGGPPLTPLDLCDMSASSPDVLTAGYQGAHSGGLAMPNQGALAPVLPSSGANSSLQGSSNMAVGNNFPSSGPFNASVRDGRYGVPRSTPLPIDEQQRMPYNQMFSGRNMQQSAMSMPGTSPGNDRGMRMMPGGNGVGIMPGMNRSMPITRPGFQGVASPSMLNSGSMVSSSMMPSPVNMHSGVASGQGNSMTRPRDALNIIRPGHNPEHQRQMMGPDPQMQVTQGNNQGVPSYGGLSSAYPSQTSSQPVQTYPLNQQQHQMSSHPHHPHIQGLNHASNPQQRAYAIRIAKERQIHERLLQHQQLAASNAMMPPGQSQAQLPISSSLQNSSQVQPQTSSASSLPLTQSSPMTPVAPHQQKFHMSPHGINRNNPQTGGSGLLNQVGKQRPHQPQQQQQSSFQQSGRLHPQQRQQSQSQQQAKLIKGVGRGNPLMHQNLGIDNSLLNGLSTTSGGQSTEKVDQGMHLMQSQGLYPGSGLSPGQPSKPLIPPHSSNQSHPQKMYSAQPIAKQVQQMPSQSDNNSSQGHASPATSGHTLPVMASPNHQQLQPHQKMANQTPTSVQRVFPHNRQLNSDAQSKLQADQGQIDHQTMNNSSRMIATTTMPQPSMDSINVIPVVSSSSGAQWKPPEQMHDSGIPNPALTNSTGSEPMPAVGQSLGQAQSTGSMPSIGRSIGTMWQQQQQQQNSQLQTSSTPPRPLAPQQQQQQPPQQQSQQQTQHLPAGNSSLYIRSTNSRLE
ncbi:Nucleoplasmin ATPase [Bertholletia excelsa]